MAHIFIKRSEQSFNFENNTLSTRVHVKVRILINMGERDRYIDT